MGILHCHFFIRAGPCQSFDYSLLYPGSPFFFLSLLCLDLGQAGIFCVFQVTLGLSQYSPGVIHTSANDRPLSDFYQCSFFLTYPCPERQRWGFILFSWLLSFWLRKPKMHSSHGTGHFHQYFYWFGFLVMHTESRSAC